MMKRIVLIFIFVTMGAILLKSWQSENKNQDGLDFRDKMYKNIVILHQVRSLCPKLTDAKVDLSCLCQKHSLLNKQIELIEKLLAKNPNFDLTKLPLHETEANVIVIYDIDLIRSLKQELGFCDENL